VEFRDVISCQDLPSKLGMAGQLLVCQPWSFALHTRPCAAELKPRAGFEIPAIHVASRAEVRTSTPDLARGVLPAPRNILARIELGILTRRAQHVFTPGTSNQPSRSLPAAVK
jgi:hypothetical protein